GKEWPEGVVVRLSKRSAEIVVEEPIELHANLRINLEEVDHGLAAKDFYGKVVGSSAKKKLTYAVRFTAVPPEVAAYFLAFRKHPKKPAPK
ncbi:MAG: hypothetical protein ACW97O_13005, partial [Candidatus Thorarchaeota archaeon]